ncbi:MAG: YcgN family cysteine cluster protein [Alphaproteobacteria bacterium]
MTDDTAPRFWRTKTLLQMSAAEWESLCDGCAKCCLVKLADEDGAAAVAYTDVACRLLDQGSCRCTRYPDRKRLVPDCVVLTSESVATLDWMPSTCAYRLVAEGRDLPWWHPLVSGDPETVHVAGISVRHRVISETEIDDRDLEDRIVDWPR